MNTANNTLSFNEHKLEHAFNLSSPNTLIKVKRVIVKSLLGQKPDLWGGKLYRLNPRLELKWISFNRVRTENFEIPVHNGPMHLHPIFDLDIISPDPENRRNTDFYRCEIKLSYEPQDDIKPEITLEYETNNGVHLQN